MGLGNNAGSSTFVSIKDGKLHVKKDKEISTFGHLSGYLAGLEIKDDEYEGKKYKKLSLTIVDATDRFIMDIRVGSGYWIGFCMTIPNVDLAKEMALIPNMKNENGKDKRTMFISQDGKALKRFWTKANPGQLPPLEVVTFKNQDHWDSSKQDNFLIEYLTHQIKPNLAHPIFAGGPSDAAAKPAVDKKPLPANADDITEPIDDLPF
jgi:hypothetical protein